MKKVYIPYPPLPNPTCKGISIQTYEINMFNIARIENSGVFLKLKKNFTQEKKSYKSTFLVKNTVFEENS